MEESAKCQGFVLARSLRQQWMFIVVKIRLIVPHKWRLKMDSQTLLIVVITVLICAVIGAGAWFYVNKMRSRRLKQRFGPEYDRVVDSFKTARRRKRNCSIARIESQNTRWLHCRRATKPLIVKRGWMSNGALSTIPTKRWWPEIS